MKRLKQALVRNATRHGVDGTDFRGIAKGPEQHAVFLTLARQLCDEGELFFHNGAFFKS